MASTAKRTLWIEAKLQDQLSRPLTEVERKIIGFGDKAGREFDSVGKRGTLGLGKIATALTALVSAYAGAQGLAFVRSVGESTASIGRLAEVTGDSVRNLSELRAAFETVGGKGEAFTGVIRQLQAASRQAQSGNLELLRGFQALGLEIEDLQRLAPSELFERIVAGLERFSSAQEKEFRLGRILPEQFLQLLPLVGRGLEEFQQRILAVRRVSATVLPEEARISEKFEQSLVSMRQAFEGLARSLLVQFGPSLTVVFEKLARLIADNREAIAGIAKSIGVGIVQAIDLVVRGIIELVGVIEKIPGINLLPKEEVERIEAEIRRLDALRIEARKRGARAGDAGAPNVRAEMQVFADQINELNRKLESGLSDRLRQIRSNLQSELRAGIDAIRSAPPEPVTGAAAAAAVGLPTADEVERIMADIYATMSQSQANGAAPFPTAFLDRPSVSAGAGPTQNLSEQLKTQLAQVQSLSQIAPTLRPLQVKLAELKRDAAILELSQASQGVLNAEELREAVALVNQEFLRSQRLISGGDFFEGFSEGARNAIRQWTDFRQAGLDAANAIVGQGLDGFSAAVGAAIAKVKSWKDAFKDWANAVLADLSRVAARLATIAILSALGFADGGVIQGGTGQPMQVKALAGGGVLTSPTLALMGEGKYDEAVIPMPNGKVPVELRGGRGGNVIHATFRIETLDGKAAARVLNENADVIGSILRQQLNNQTQMRQFVSKAAS